MWIGLKRKACSKIFFLEKRAYVSWLTFTLSLGTSPWEIEPADVDVDDSTSFLHTWREDEGWTSLKLVCTEDETRSHHFLWTLLKGCGSPLGTYHHKSSALDSCSAAVRWMENLFLISSGPGLRSQALSLACRPPQLLQKPHKQTAFVGIGKIFLTG